MQWQPNQVCIRCSERYTNLIGLPTWETEVKKRGNWNGAPVITQLFDGPMPFFLVAGMDSRLTVYGIKTGGEAMDLGLRVPNPWGNQGICMHGRARAP